MMANMTLNNFYIEIVSFQNKEDFNNINNLLDKSTYFWVH